MLIIILSLVYKSVSAQKNVQSINFIKQIITEKDSIFYFDHLDNAYFKEIKKVLEHDTLVDAGYFLAPANPPTTLILGKNEKVFIQKKLKKWRDFSGNQDCSTNPNYCPPANSFNLITFKDIIWNIVTKKCTAFQCLYF